jgi:hypothetical protein
LSNIIKVVVMKKFLLWSSILLMFVFTLSGCKIKSTDLPFIGKKPNPYYYTNLLANRLLEDTKSSGVILETNLHKEKNLTADSLDTLKNFFKAIKTANFIDKPEELPNKPKYRIYLKVKGERYIINVYNERYLSVHPWDGVYPMDYIDMKDVAVSYNLNNLCKYIFK